MQKCDQTFFRHRLLEKVSRKKFRKILFLRPLLKLKHSSYLVFFDIFANPDLIEVHIPIYHRKMVENFKIIIFSENIVLELPFGVGFDKIRQQARFLCYFEIC